jgi:hypothetical protein
MPHVCHRITMCVSAVAFDLGHEIEIRSGTQDAQRSGHVLREWSNCVRRSHAQIQRHFFIVHDREQELRRGEVLVIVSVGHGPWASDGEQVISSYVPVDSFANGSNWLAGASVSWANAELTTWPLTESVAGSWSIAG